MRTIIDFLPNSQHPLVGWRANVTSNPSSPLTRLPVWLPGDWQSRSFPKHAPDSDYALSCRQWAQDIGGAIATVAHQLERRPPSHPETDYPNGVDASRAVGDLDRLTGVIETLMSWPNRPAVVVKEYDESNLAQAAAQFETVIGWIVHCLETQAIVVREPEQAQQNGFDESGLFWWNGQHYLITVEPLLLRFLWNKEHAALRQVHAARGGKDQPLTKQARKSLKVAIDRLNDHLASQKPPIPIQFEVPRASQTVRRTHLPQTM